MDIDGNSNLPFDQRSDISFYETQIDDDQPDKFPSDLIPEAPDNIDDGEILEDNEEAAVLEQDAPKYDLRPPNPNPRSKFLTTWLDGDDSGNYGDKSRSEALRKARGKRERTRMQQQEFIDPLIDGPDENDADNEDPTKFIPRLLVTLKFRNEAARVKVYNLVLNSSCESHSASDEAGNGYKLRKCSAAAGSRYHSEYHLDGSNSAPELSKGLNGHPIARGCWACVPKNAHCSLLDNEHSWPCTDCCEEGDDCELIAPPALKLKCEQCRKRRKVCSYTTTLSHGETCQQCMDEGCRCIAGPAKEGIRTRIRIDRDWQNDPLAKKSPGKARKSICEKKKEDERSRGSLQLHKPQSQRPRPGEKRQREGPDSTPSRPPKIAKPTISNRPTVFKIKTKLCHPIKFNYEDETAGEEPCHFCSEAGYPIIGLGTKEVEVVECEDGTALEEISGGHKSESVENTKICPRCVLHRLPIITCQIHQPRPIVGISLKSLDMNAAFEELLSENTKVKRKWCAICPSLATYECCAEQDGGGGGCGLLLCEHCALTLSGRYGGDLQNMLPELRDEPTKERMFGLRADYELLREDGLLMRFVLQNSQ